MFARTVRMAAPLLLVITACADTGPGVLVRAELMRLPEPVVAGAAREAALSDPPWTSNITFTSVRGPVSEIYIAGPGVTTILYSCPGATSADCLVEMNGPALESLLPTSAVAAQPGTYDEVIIGYCKPPETGWSARLTGSVVISGITWYTNTAANLSASGPAQPVTTSYTGCGSAYAIVPPLVVSDTLPVTVLVRLYFDLRDLGYASRNDPATAHHRGIGCTGPSIAGYVCAAYTSIIAVPGAALPIVERYRVNSYATIGLVFDATDRFVGGYNRRYYVEDEAFTPGVNPDGHYDIMTPSGAGTYRLTSRAPGNDFPAFQRSTHSGMVLVHVGGPTPIINIPYTAVRLP